MTHRQLLTTALLAALFTTLATLPAAFAQQAGTEATADAHATVPTEQLAERYAELAGSTGAAADLVRSLREGTESAAAMGYGEIDLTLAMAESLIDNGAAADVDIALDQVLGLRADGMGMGEIAQELGFNPGELVSASHRADVAAGGGAEAGLAIADEASGGLAGTEAGAATAADARTRAAIGADISTDVRANARVDAGARGTVSGRPAGVRVPALPTRPLLPERPQRGNR
ncbi:hypothetical protein [Luteimonas suaedae]|uniref:hypothetical protein n=1 Tax=Luteimonas suaedae TaxID=2605430 RepID=UPI0011F00DFC|nr:hypothetical protein [Luteimonas suaedae]